VPLHGSSLRPPAAITPPTLHATCPTLHATFLGRQCLSATGGELGACCQGESRWSPFCAFTRETLAALVPLPTNCMLPPVSAERVRRAWLAGIAPLPSPSHTHLPSCFFGAESLFGAALYAKQAAMIPSPALGLLLVPLRRLPRLLRVRQRQTAVLGRDHLSIVSLLPLPEPAEQKCTYQLKRWLCAALFDGSCTFGCAPMLKLVAASSAGYR